VKFLMNLELSV